MTLNKFTILLIIFILLLTTSSAQTIAIGESSVFKKGHENKAYYEAIVDAQKNAFVLYGGNVSSQTTETTSELNQAEKLNQVDKYKASNTFSKAYQSIVNLSANASVKLDKIIKADTINVGGRNYKIQVKGKFTIQPNDAINTLGANFLKVGKKIKISIIENDCQGEIYSYLSEYLNSRNNNFIFSKGEWALQEEDFGIEINNKEIVLKNKHNLPNTIVKKYEFNSCADLIKYKKEPNKLFDEIMGDIYFLQLFEKTKKQTK